MLGPTIFRRRINQDGGGGWERASVVGGLESKRSRKQVQTEANDTTLQHRPRGLLAYLPEDLFISVTRKKRILCSVPQSVPKCSSHTFGISGIIVWPLESMSNTLHTTYDTSHHVTSHNAQLSHTPHVRPDAVRDLARDGDGGGEIACGGGGGMRIRFDDV